MKFDLTNLHLKTGIDTICITSREVPTKLNEASLFGASKKVLVDADGVPLYHTKVNPNDYGGDVYSYKEYLKVMTQFDSLVGMGNYKVTRVDFRVDTFEDNYDLFYKLNKCFVLLIAEKCNLRNRYEPTDPLLLNHETIVAKSQYFEVENYDKEFASGGIDAVKGRLELRSKSLFKFDKSIPVLAADWQRRLKTLPALYDKLQQKANGILSELWISKRQESNICMSEFVRTYQENIFSFEQLRNLFRLIGSTNSHEAAKSFRNRNSHIYFISEQDLVGYITVINKSFDQFLAS